MHRSWITAFGAFCTLLAGTATAGAAPTIVFKKPTTGAAVEDGLGVLVSVTSPYSVTKVEAKVETVSTPLTPSGSDWSGTLSIASIGYGIRTLTVSATDFVGDVGTATTTIYHDKLPTLSIGLPGYYAVARPDLAVKLTCTQWDGSDCASCAVRGTAAAGKGSIDTTISLSSYEGQIVRLVFEGRTTGGLVGTEERWVFVDLSKSLTEVATVPGRVMDFDCARIRHRRRQAESP